MSQSTTQTTSRQRTQIRQAAGLSPTRTNVPVYLIHGQLSPRRVGVRGGHFTRGGSRIRHPGAYGRCGWSNMIYRCSTQRIYVGDQWVAANVH